jgi:hypothetical protein
MTILILDGETNQALAATRSLGAGGFRVAVASTWRGPLASWSRHCSARFRLGAPRVESYRALRQWAVERGVRVVLPLTERSCVLCNTEREAWEAAGIIVGCAPPAILERAFD